MKIEIMNDQDDFKIQQFTSVLNKAFLARTSKTNRNPFTPMSYTQIKEEIQRNYRTYIMLDGDTVTGGVCYDVMTIGSKKIGVVSRVCVDPEYQRRGIAQELLENVYGQAVSDGCDWIELNVGSAWVAAVSLYKRMGYEITEIAAHIPGTYALYKMVRIINSQAYPKWERAKKHFMSWVKFKILFHPDSTPNMFCKLLFK